MMKRPPGLWLLLSAGVLWLSMQDVCGIRATSLIFAKSTTTTTEASPAEASPDESATETITEPPSNLTGNPQLDYIYDPNLPKELNGYNLSAYPFYERVPEDLDFKCDGLHDGFYASVAHKCQVYHHCLFGTRFDFLCANYTAFDQKTFICHFVSEVDCVNSKKYWHRNDALYQAASTTTVKPVVVTTPAPPPPPELPPANPRRPGGGGRRYLRKRPNYDYYEEYDDYYDERPSRSEARRRTRPRPRPRPVYDDEYEEYDDDRYERRGSGRRRPSERRRNQDRRKQVDAEEGDRPGHRRYHKKRPVDDYVDEEDDRRRNRPKGGKRRPVEDEFEDDEPPRKEKPNDDDAADKPMIKPTSGASIYDRPRTAPRIKPPVPKSEASKYAYKPVATKAPPVEDEEYYDDYEDEAPPKNHRKSEGSESRRHTTRHEEERDTRKQSGSRLRASQSSRDEETSEEEVPKRAHKPKNVYHRERPRSSTKKPPPLEDDYYDELEDISKEEVKTEKQKFRPTTAATTTTTTKATTTATTTTTTTPKPGKDSPRQETMVRIVKRPFLPSRGGNPLASRGLQPVGAKALDKKPEEDVEVKPAAKTTPVIIKMPHRQKYVSAQTDSQEEFKPVSNRPQVPPRQSFKPNKEHAGPRTTQKPKLPDPDPLDLIEDEYDVTLNDALNPTLPNLPVRGYPTGFSSANDYNYNAFQRPRYVLEAAASEYSHAKPNRQRVEAVQYSNPQEHFVNSNVDYKGQYSTINRESYRPRVTQAYITSF